MIGIDTNVLVRLLAGDDRVQASRAHDLVQASDIWVCATVLLETEWVLRSAYHFAPGAISAALRGFLGLPNVTAESPATIAEALDAYEAGLDFADALHLASSRRASAFYTFDRRLVHAAKAANLGQAVQEVPKRLKRAR